MNRIQKTYLDKNKLLFFLLLPIFMFSWTAEALFVSNCSLEVSRCCSVFSQNADVYPCGCKEKSYEECANVFVHSDCRWNSNITIEEDCAARVNASDCFSVADCNWMEDIFGNSFCSPLLCEDMPCIALTDFNNVSNCQARPDCVWSIYDDACKPNLNCSCAHLDDLQRYCPCLKTDKQCTSQQGCFWDTQDGCGPENIISSAASALASSVIVMILSGLVAFAF